MRYRSKENSVAQRIRRAFEKEEERAQAYWAEHAKGKSPDQISVPFPRFYIGKLERELQEEGVVPFPKGGRDE